MQSTSQENLPAQVERAKSTSLWPELQFPPLNLWVMPKHDVLIYAHGASLDPNLFEEQ